MIDTPPELIATAYHEAGHAVTAWKHGFKIKRATIIPEEDSLGHVLTAGLNKAVFNALETGYVSLTQRDRIEKRIIGLLAGRIAEERFTGKNNSEGAESDRAQVADFALALCGSVEETNAYVEWLHIRAKGSVNTLWSSIERVAEELIKFKTLSGENVAAVILKQQRQNAPP